jgi:hypothetical protein
MQNSAWAGVAEMFGKLSKWHKKVNHKNLIHGLA